ncbi:hypothetical protein [Variovorax atrisoli]|uniref:hypothetical protein n=1 Tax=Variovorax atrisoli TaxID=3394203 RepID=UPI00036247B5|nr:hypothetical protein [Variovorax paradoxus]
MLDSERQKRGEADAAQAAASKRVEEAETRAKEAEQRAQELEAARRQLELQRVIDVDQAEKRARTESERAETAERNFSRQRYIALFYVLPIVLGVAAAAFANSNLVAEAFPALAQGWRCWALLVSVSLLPVSIGFLLSPGYVTRRQHLDGWWPARCAHFIGKRLIVAPTLAGLGAIFQGGVWDGAKALLGIGS